ncbi:MAG: chorismate mutase [Lachnospiraceae bacterium]|nr:chorismate mutase [Ruminococcus sp.]MCM1273821.1 chorismate mutase [Lachnospiraceae bacterium]
MNCKSLEEIRSNIDRIDDEIIKLIVERTDYVKQAAKFKKSADGVKAPERVEAVVRKARESAERYGADADTVEALYRTMISSFIEAETHEFNKNNTQGN